MGFFLEFKIFIFWVKKINMDYRKLIFYYDIKFDFLIDGYNSWNDNNNL